jgi:hypothetical protein
VRSAKRTCKRPPNKAGTMAAQKTGIRAVQRTGRGQRRGQIHKDYKDMYDGG